MMKNLINTVLSTKAAKLVVLALNRVMMMAFLSLALIGRVFCNSTAQYITVFVASFFALILSVGIDVELERRWGNEH